MLQRDVLNSLNIWLKNSNRKPLILRGARQVGKTWTVRQLANNTGRRLIEFNFENNPAAIQLFNGNDPKQIFENIQVSMQCQAEPNQVILFLDEIQTAPELVAKLRWFYELFPELPVIAAGSLLDFSLNDFQYSMPVGRVSFYYLEPLSFGEFLQATDQQQLREYIQSLSPQHDIAMPIHQKLLNASAHYSLIGGLPEAVNTWVRTQSFERVNEIQNNLIATYHADFNKYPTRIAPERMLEVMNAIPNSMGEKFKYSNVNKDVASSSIKNALELLCTARVAHKIKSVSASGIPLAATTKDKYFKIMSLDCGLISGALGLTKGLMPNNPLPIFINQGGLSEQYVGQQLRVLEPYYIDPQLFYWIREQKGSSSEVDYVIQQNQHIIPIEVKSGTTGTLKSLHRFMHSKQLNLAVRINADTPSITQVDTKLSEGYDVRYQLLSLPFYAISELPRWLNALLH